MHIIVSHPRHYPLFHTHRPRDPLASFVQDALATRDFGLDRQGSQVESDGKRFAVRLDVSEFKPEELEVRFFEIIRDFCVYGMDPVFGFSFSGTFA